MSDFSNVYGFGASYYYTPKIGLPSEDGDYFVWVDGENKPFLARVMTVTLDTKELLSAAIMSGNLEATFGGTEVIYYDFGGAQPLRLVKAAAAMDGLNYKHAKIPEFKVPTEH